MSGYTANVISSQGVLDDGINFIEKPISINNLGHRIREILEENGVLERQCFRMQAIMFQNHPKIGGNYHVPQTNL